MLQPLEILNLESRSLKAFTLYTPLEYQCNLRFRSSKAGGRREISLASRRFPLPQSPSQLLISFNSMLMLNTFVTILLLVTVIYFVWQNNSKISNGNRTEESNSVCNHTSD